MAIIKNDLTYGYGFNITAAGPVDSRMRVNYIGDLTTVWGTYADGKFTANAGVNIYAGMMVVVNDQNKAYILKQQVADGYTIDEQTEIVKNGLVYDRGTDNPIPANPTKLSNWMPVGSDLSGDISALSGKVDAVESKLNIAADSGLDATSALKVKIDTTVAGNILNVTKNGLSVVASQSDYSLQAVTIPDTNYAAQYQFIKDGTVQTTINIPKDQFLRSATFHAIAEDGVTTTAPYLKFVWDLANDMDPYLEGVQNTTYVPVADLVDTYSEGDYITITDNVISVDYNTLKTKLDIDLRSAFGIATLTTDVNKNSSDIAAINQALNEAGTGIKATIAKNASDISGINTTVDALSTTVNAHDTTLNTIGNTLASCKVRSVNTSAVSGISLTHTSSKGDGNNDTVGINVDINTLAAAVIAKHQVPTPTAGDIKLSAAVGSNSADSTVQAVLANLEGRIQSAVSGGITGISGGSTINVDTTTATNPAISVNTQNIVKTGSALSVENNQIDLIWAEL